MMLPRTLRVPVPSKPRPISIVKQEFLVRTLGVDVPV